MPAVGALQAVDSSIGQLYQQGRLPHSPSMQLLMSSQANLHQEMDLVTVTPQGLAVTPLNGQPPPLGIPMLQEVPQTPQQGLSAQQVPADGLATGSAAVSPRALAMAAGPRQQLDIVTVTPQGLAVTPLNGNPPPVGVPFIDPAIGGYHSVPAPMGHFGAPQGLGPMYAGMPPPQMPTGHFGPHAAQGAARWPSQFGPLQ